MSQRADETTRTSSETWGRGAALMVPVALAVALLVLVVVVRGSVERTISRVADLLPVGYAFAAGMVASVNPCGALMLPSYVLFHLGARDADEVPTLDRVLRALRLALATTVGFAAIFGIVGMAVGVGGRWLMGFFPYAGLLIGVGMVGTGAWLLVSRRSLGILAASRISIAPQRSLPSMVLFGVAYAISSLSCTLPVFLVVVGTALTVGGWMTSVAQFLGYALGMGTVFAAVTIGTSLFRQAVENLLRRVLPYVHRVSALFLVGVGIFLIYYWVFEVGLRR